MRAPLALGLAFALASGCMGGAAPEPTPTPSPTPSPEPELKRLDQALVVRARGAHEANLQLAANDTIAYRWNASAAIAWDLHSHEGSEVKTWASGKEKLAEGEFTAPTAGVYSLFFQNAEAYPIHVTYHVEGAFTVA